MSRMSQKHSEGAVLVIAGCGSGVDAMRRMGYEVRWARTCGVHRYNTEYMCNVAREKPDASTGSEGVKSLHVAEMPIHA